MKGNKKLEKKVQTWQLFEVIKKMINEGLKNKNEKQKNGG